MPEIREYAGPKPGIRKKTGIKDPVKILQALNQTDWNKAKAARLLGISRPTLYELASKRGVNKP